MGPRLVAHDPSVRVGILAAKRPKAFRRGHLPSCAREEGLDEWRAPGGEFVGDQ